MSEVLYKCPACGTPNFTWRGLKAHQCQAKPGRGRLSPPEIVKASAAAHTAAKSPSMSKSQTHALTIVAAPEFRVAANDLENLQHMAVAQVAAIGEMENKAALGGVLAGLTLHRVKSSMPHGQFGKWIEQISAKGSKTHRGALLTIKARQCQYYMRLALIFLEKSRVAKPDLLALPGDQTELSLEGSSGPAKRFAEKLHAFVGECSLNELLVKHNIKGVSRDSDAAEGESATTATGEDFFAEVAERIDGWRKVVTDPAALVRLSPKQLELLHEQVTEATATFRKLYAKAVGTKKS